MRRMSENLRNMMALGSVLAFTALVTAAPALAHHPLGGSLPTNFWHGFLSGIGHPIIGIDHLAFIIAVGVASAFLKDRYLMPALFIGATVVGCLIYSVGGVELPLTEFFVAASVFLLGALIMSGHELSTKVCGILFALAGLFHGTAYAGAILGAEATPLVAYLIGFSFIQYAIILTTMFIVRQTWKAADRLAIESRLAGALVAGVGGSFLIENVESVIFPGM